MNRFDLNWLLGVVEGSMNVTIFDSRYSDGLVVVLTARTEHGAAIEDNFSGGDNDWVDVRFPLSALQWFPIVFVETIDQAIPALVKKLKEIEDMKLDYVKWGTCVEWIGSLIEKDKHRRALSGVNETHELQDINFAYDNLSNHF